MLGHWLTVHKDEITSACAVLALFVGVGGFWLTVRQLSLTVRQLSDARRVLQAANGYQIQKDARELIDKVTADKTFREALGRETLPWWEDDADVLDKLWLMFNFYLSVYRQAEAGGISGEFVSEYMKDFRGFVNKPAVDQGWKKLRQRGSIGDDHVVMREQWCNA